MALRGSLAPIGEADVVLGIDLGTHYSTAGAWLRNKLYLAPDERGEVCIPSVVHVPAGRDLVVGAEAERLRLSEPGTTIVGVKRLLGRKRTDGSVRLFEAQSAVPLTTKDGELALRARGRDLSAVEVASAIFRYLRERMEVRLGGSIHRAVITVPVATTKAARDATARAARMAGLEVLRVVAEPCAAAVALTRPAGKERRVLVYDFGGGTFDAAVVTMRGDSLTVQAAGGDDCLGGDDLDEALARSISSHLWQSARVDVTKDAVRWPRLMRHSERVKRALSTAERTRFRLEDAWAHKGRPQDLDMMVTRADVDALWAELVDRSLRASAEVLLSAGLRPQNLDGIAMVGGTTWVPKVRRDVERVLGRPLTGELDPQTAVAAGAAMVAARAAELNAA